MDRYNRAAERWRPSNCFDCTRSTEHTIMLINACTKSKYPQIKYANIIIICFSIMIVVTPEMLSYSSQSHLVLTLNSHCITLNSHFESQVTIRGIIVYCLQNPIIQSIFSIPSVVVQFPIQPAPRRSHLQLIQRLGERKAIHK